MSLGSADSTQDQIKEPGFKQQLLATMHKYIDINVVSLLYTTWKGQIIKILGIA